MCHKHISRLGFNSHLYYIVIYHKSVLNSITCRFFLLSSTCFSILFGISISGSPLRDTGRYFLPFSLSRPPPNPKKGGGPGATTLIKAKLLDLKFKALFTFKNSSSEILLICQGYSFESAEYLKHLALNQLNC